MWIVIDDTTLHEQLFRKKRLVKKERVMGRDDCERTRQLPVEGQEVYHWPEFKALCKRLGVSWECETTKITITLAPGELALVCQDYQGTDRHLQQPPAGIPPEGTPHPESEASGG